MSEGSPAVRRATKGKILIEEGGATHKSGGGQYFSMISFMTEEMARYPAQEIAILKVNLTKDASSFLAA